MWCTRARHFSTVRAPQNGGRRKDNSKVFTGPASRTCSSHFPALRSTGYRRGKAIAGNLARASFATLSLAVATATLGNWSINPSTLAPLSRFCFDCHSVAELVHMQLVRQGGGRPLHGLDTQYAPKFALSLSPVLCPLVRSLKTKEVPKTKSWPWIQDARIVSCYSSL